MPGTISRANTTYVAIYTRDLWRCCCARALRERGRGGGGRERESVLASLVSSWNSAHPHFFYPQRERELRLLHARTHGAWQSRSLSLFARASLIPAHLANPQECNPEAAESPREGNASDCKSHSRERERERERALDYVMAKWGRMLSHVSLSLPFSRSLRVSDLLFHAAYCIYVCL